MALLEINKNPSDKELKQFACIWFPAFFVVLGIVAGTKFGIWSIVIPVWLAVGLVSFAGAMNPRMMRPIFVGWMTAAYPIGWTVSHLVLAITYYLVMTPIGLLIRLSGRDPMQRKWNREAKSYWIAREGESDKKRYFK